MRGYFFATRFKAVMSAALAAACCIGAIARGEDASPPPPDAAAHTVIVPFDPEKPLHEQKPDRFYLDYATFQKLWSETKENRRPPKPELDAGSGVTVNLALHDVQVNDNALQVSSKFTIGTRGEWQTVSLPLSIDGTDAADWTLDGRAAPFKEDAILLEKAGMHQVEAKVTAGLARGWQQADLAFPSGMAGLLRISVPLSDGMPDLGQETQPPLVSEEVRDSRRVFTFALSQGGEVTLKRQAARRADAQAPPAVCEVRSVVTVHPHVEQLESEFLFRFPGVERSSFTVMVDEDVKPVTWGAWEVLAVDNQQVTGWRTGRYRDVTLRRENGRLLADIRLLRPVRDHFRITLSGVRSQANVEGARKAPFVGASASRLDSTMQLNVAPALKVSATPGNAERILPKVSSKAPAAGAWRLREGDTVSYTVSTADGTASAEMELLAQVGASKLEIMVAATLKAGRLPLREAYLRLPQGYEVQSAQGAGLRGWQRDEGGVFVQFDASVSSEARLILNAALTRAPGEAAANLPVVFFDDMAKQKAAVFIAVNAATDVRLQFDRAWQETDPATKRSVFTVSPPWVLQRALLWESDAVSAKQPPAAPTVTLVPQTPKFSTDTVLLVRSADEMLGFSQQVGINVEQGAVSGLKVRLPAALPEARVGGPDVRDVQVSTQGETREYQVTFQGEILGSASVTLDWELPPTPEASLPLVAVDGASRSRRFFIVENSSSREMKTALTQVEKTVASAVPWLPEGFATADLYQARSADAEMKLTFSNTQATAGNAAIVTLAEITTALRPNGERWETVVYSLANRSLQFLPVRLPKGAELVTVMVGDEMVRADWGEPSTVAGAKSAPCHLVPLLQMRAGQLSQEVRLTYFVPAPEGGKLSGKTNMDDPELAGLSAERTLWNVWVPEGHELDEFDGNMEEVVEEVIEDEKVQQKLSDVLRLNRIVSMSSTSVSDAKEAMDNASRALKEVSQYQESKKSRSYRSEESKPMFKGKAAKAAQDEEVRSKSNAQVEKQLQQQQQLLDGNAGKFKELTKNGEGNWQVQGAKGVQGAQGTATVNTWAYNGTAAVKSSKGEKVVLEGANTVLNDNVAVSNGFLTKQGNGTLTLPQAGQMPQTPQKVVVGATGNIVLNNARSASNFEQGAAAPVANASTSNRGTTTLGSLSSNAPPGDGRASGTLTISGGTTLQIPVPTADQPPVGGPALRGNGTITINGAMNSPADPFAPMPSVVAGPALPAAPSARPAPSLATPPPPPEPMPQTLNMSTAANAAPEEARGSGVQDKLALAYNHYNLGDFDQADAAFQEVLRAEPSNAAARRGMERSAQARAEYVATAQDHTRARMLNEVNRGWEDGPESAAAVTAQLKPQGRVSMPVQVPLTGTVYHFRKLKDHATLELDVDKPLEPERQAALWIVVFGVLMLAGVAWMGRKREASRQQEA